jgi:hypothetical protein
MLAVRPAERSAEPSGLPTEVAGAKGSSKDVARSKVDARSKNAAGSKGSLKDVAASKAPYLDDRDDPAKNPAVIGSFILNMYPEHVLDPSYYPRDFDLKNIKLSKDPRAVVQMASEMVKRGDAGPVTKRAVEQAAALMSEERVGKFLLALDEEAFRSLAGPGGRIEVPLADFDSWSQRAGARSDGDEAHYFYRLIERKEHSVEIRYQPKFATMIEAAFFATVRANYASAGKARAEKRAKRAAARPQSPKLTAPVYQVQDNLEKYVGKCMYFDNVRVHGDPERMEFGGVPAEDLFRVPITDERGGYMLGRDNVLFVCSKELADHWRGVTLANSRVEARIYCEIERGQMGKALAEIYKIQAYDRHGQLIEVTAERGLTVVQ